MKKSIIIGSMNVQNKYKIPDYDGLDDKGNDNTLILKEFLDRNKIDILGTQELVRPFIERLKKTLLPDYKIFGDYRYGHSKLVQKFQILDRFNETVSIITKHKVLRSKTTTMPWFPKNIKDVIRGLKLKSIRPRVVTTALIEIEGFGTVNFINTHLDHRLNIIQIRQLNYLHTLIEKSKYPVILTGDFNMDVNMPRFNKFVINLECIGYKRVPNTKKTYKYQEDKLPIDHIFVPKEWKIEEIAIATDKYLDSFSDHYPIIVKVSK